MSKGVYGFLMKPVFTDAPSSRSKHFSILADYACSREGADIFFFLKRKIVYGGKIYGNKDAGSFYINGLNSPLGRKTNANLFWDESSRYKKTEQEGVFKVNGANKAQPFMFQFRQNENTGKYIVSDDLKEFLNLEKEIIGNNILSGSYKNGSIASISLNLSPELSNAYDELFSYYKEKNNIPSLVYLDDNLKKIYEKIVDVFNKEVSEEKMYVHNGSRF